MRFQISRTSQGYTGYETEEEAVPPIPTAVRGFISQWQLTSHKTEEMYNKLKRPQEPKWRDYGSEHTTYKHGIKRRLPHDEKIWYIEVKDLDELLQLIDNYGRVVIMQPARDVDGQITYPDHLPSIEIYDTYRE